MKLQVYIVTRTVMAEEELPVLAASEEEARHHAETHRPDEWEWVRNLKPNPITAIRIAGPSEFDQKDLEWINRDND